MTDAKRLSDQFRGNDASRLDDSRSEIRGQKLDQEGGEAVRGGNGFGRYAFTGVDRTGGTFGYDVTDPNAPRFMRGHNARDVVAQQGPCDEVREFDFENTIFVSAVEGPFSSDVAMRIVGSEISGTVAVYSVSAQ